MNRLSLVTVLAFTGAAAGAHASVLVVGGGLAQSCYQAADARDKSHNALQICNRALVEEALTQDDRVATHVNRGIVHFARGAQQQAVADFDKALSLDPTEPDAWLNKAVVTVQAGSGAEYSPAGVGLLHPRDRRGAARQYPRRLQRLPPGPAAGAEVEGAGDRAGALPGPPAVEDRWGRAP